MKVRQQNRLWKVKVLVKDQRIQQCCNRCEMVDLSLYLRPRQTRIICFAKGRPGASSSLSHALIFFIYKFFFMYFPVKIKICLLSSPYLFLNPIYFLFHRTSAGCFLWHFCVTDIQLCLKTAGGVMLRSSVCTCLTLAARHPPYPRKFKMSWYIKEKLSRHKIAIQNSYF